MTKMNVKMMNSTRRNTWCIVFLLFVVSRLWSTIYYIEDLDSLRFALAMKDYDVTAYQPHFPAYPVFCFLSKLIYILTGHYTLAFSAVGGLSAFSVIYFLLRTANIQPNSRLGILTIVLIFFNPLLWIMSNRYMPDMMGSACIMACFHYLVPAPFTPKIGNYRGGAVNKGFFLTGLLLGIRLSYVPFLLPLLFVNLVGYKTKLPFWERCHRVGCGLLGVVVWFVPLILMTGWTDLVESAQIHSRGHFTEFGGTVMTESNFGLRLSKLFESIWADGFGFYWSERHLSTAVSTFALILIILMGGIRFTQLSTSKTNSRVAGIGSLKEAIIGKDFLYMLTFCCLTYLFWIFFCQNVVHKSRHVLPLLPFLTLMLAYIVNITVAHTVHYGENLVVKGVLVVWLFSFGYVSLQLVSQHKRPTAIAQTLQLLRDLKEDQIRPLQIISVPLIKYYLKAQGFESDYISINGKDNLDLTGQLDPNAEWLTIGSPLPNEALSKGTSKLGHKTRKLKAVHTFYHNPYVNRMWPKLNLYIYGIE